MQIEIWQNKKICYNYCYKLKWHIILVNLIYYEDGAKNPLKGISMKRLVLASYAQFGVSAGRYGCLDDCNGIQDNWSTILET